jgi:hypothetical protein
MTLRRGKSCEYSIIIVYPGPALTDIRPPVGLLATTNDPLDVSKLHLNLNRIIYTTLYTRPTLPSLLEYSLDCRVTDQLFNAAKGVRTCPPLLG